VRAALAGALLVGVVATAHADGEAPLLDEQFDSLDPARWEVVRVHDAKADRVVAEGGRLVLAANTLGTDDATVKLRGVRTKAAFAAAPGRGLRVGLVLDWNDQANGCYLTTGVALVPEGAGPDPRALPDALAFELVGVPPGKNVRPSLWRRQAGGLQPLFTDGWPQAKAEDRVGRSPRRARWSLEVLGERVRLLEDERVVHEGPGGLAQPVHVVVFMTSHSNYPERTVLVDDVRVERLP
jgi:hypothetical protein